MSEEVTMQTQPEKQPSKGAKIWAGIKEWFRKKVVTLKIKPQLIPLVVLLVTSVCFMLFLHSFSVAIYATYNSPQTKATGIVIFITTLLSVLVLVSFLNAFPKRKKPNIFFVVLVFAMLGAMLACDIVYYVQMENCIEVLGSDSSIIQEVQPAQPNIIAHIVLLGVSTVMFALLPAYSRLIRMINTSVKLESATENMKGNIDIQED